jgi:hypothetical protein
MNLLGLVLRSRAQRKEEPMQRYWYGLGALVVCLLMSTPVFAVSLVVNGGFETGDFSGWTLSGNTGFGVEVCEVGSSFLGSTCTSHSGDYAAVFGPPDSLGYLDQTLSTVPGGVYTVTLFLRNDNLDLPPNSEFHVFWAGSEVYSLTNAADLNYTQITVDGLVAPAVSTDLELGFRNNPGGFFVDDISVDAIPEPATLLLTGAGLLFSLGLLKRRSR